ncbi:MAG TPA: signal peptide peptidase SppA [Tepidisphaeraceae bacterium]|nr:signal peptide peptidase SppA [Tepidisphaeraceae bacterium]
MRYLIYIFCLFLAGCGLPSFVVTPVAHPSEIQEVTVKSGHGWFPSKKIAIIEVEGMLVNAKGNGLLTPAENQMSLFIQQLNEAENDAHVRAIVLRINSPGGTVNTADTMYQALMKFRQKTHKPIIADTQDLCASGAYYVACAADKIVAQPTSVVGSIGVIFETFDVENGLNKIGISTMAIKSAPLKDLASPFHHRTKAEVAVLQRIVNEYYARFKSIVATRRHITSTKELDYLANGQVFTGTDAVRLHLADVNGTLPDAIKLAKEMAHAPNASVIMYKHPYGDSGSIYASADTPAPKASNSLSLSLPGESLFVPPGFYYLWEP